MAYRSIVIALFLFIGTFLTSSCGPIFGQVDTETVEGEAHILKQEPLDSLGNQCLVTGRVIEKITDEPLPLANVTLDTMKVKTDYDGYFEFIISPGTYDLTLECFEADDVTMERIKLMPGSKTEVLLIPGFTAIVCY
ncbi:MAG: hypothetical protein SchgKO_11000 [Schleiferiaceae bacterium]